MNDMNQHELIDEDELRSALRPLRIDRDAFEAKIRRRIDAATRLHELSESSPAKPEQSGWLHVAASVLPLPLLGKGASGSLTTFSIGQLSLGQKIVAITALPAIGLMLMITATIWAVLKVRKVHRNQQSGDLDPQKMGEVTKRWWRQFGVLVVGMAWGGLLLMLIGYAIPVFIIFLISGITMVSLITRLGREQVIDRTSIASSLGPGMLLLVQITHIASMFSQGFPFLDQMLIPAVLATGGFVLLMVCPVQAEHLSRAASRLVKLVASTGGILLAGWFSSSLWNPISTDDLKAYVESFDQAPFSSASWRAWKVPAAWLRDSNMPLNMSTPYRLLETEIANDEPNARILRYAFETDLIQLQDLNRLGDWELQKGPMFRESNRGKPFLSITDRESCLVHALIMRGELDANQRDFLAERLRMTMEGLKTKTYGYLLEEQLRITKLSRLIGRPLGADSYRDWVHRTLVGHQRLNHRFGVRRGGFAQSMKLDFSNEYATADAIELMQIYGVPAEVRIDALRSYLRPTPHDSWLRNQSCVRVASLQRLESLPDVSPITWRDFLRYEQSLIMAVLFTLLCIFATVGAPKHRAHPV